MDETTQERFERAVALLAAAYRVETGQPLMGEDRTRWTARAHALFEEMRFDWCCDLTPEPEPRNEGVR